MRLTRSGTRALARIAGALTAVGLGLVFLTAASAWTPPPTSVPIGGNGSTISGVMLNGVTTTYAVVAPGSSNTITATFTVPDLGGGWAYAAPIGFADASLPFSDDGCPWGSGSGSTDTTTQSFTAPATPGIYYIRADDGMTYTCNDAWHAPSNGFAAGQSTIAMLVVTNTPPATVGGWGANATATNVMIDSVPGQNVAIVDPGSSHSITATVTIPEEAYYGYTTAMGFEGSPTSFGEDGCMYNPPGPSTVTATQPFTAPDTPGIYNIVIDMGPNYTCEQSWHSSTTTTIAQVVVVDTTAPSITLTTPVDKGAYSLGQAVTASYGCTDASSGLAMCKGDVASGSPIDTSTMGPHSFTVNTADVAGNIGAKTVHYNVYAGVPGKANCVGTTVSALSDAYGSDLAAAATALGFPTVKELQTDIKTFCRG